MYTVGRLAGRNSMHIMELVCVKENMDMTTTQDWLYNDCQHAAVHRLNVLTCDLDIDLHIWTVGKVRRANVNELKSYKISKKLWKYICA